MTAELAARFARAARRLGATDDPAPVTEALLAAWSGAGRSYHNLDHLRAVLAELDAAPAEEPVRARVEAALWFHDAVYDSRARDNEFRSAEWAERALGELGVPDSERREVGRLVRLTDHREPARDPAGRLACDADLAVLGAEPAAFASYEDAIRREYDWLDDLQWRSGRRQFLAALLARSPLYQTAHFRDRYEAAARRNLSKSLASLQPAG